MNTSQFDMSAHWKQVVRISAGRPGPDSPSKWAALKAIAQEAMDTCDRSKEQGRMDHGGILLFLCAIEDLEKRAASSNSNEREKLFLSATKKFGSAIYQYDR